mmetsp:Transcript_59017/g.93921  ORF Transcript_59017/g.93921 Transcript_59017/m.93921 type:complete len:239 (-) Transcript_59017:134-850(-)
MGHCQTARALLVIACALSVVVRIVDDQLPTSSPSHCTIVAISDDSPTLHYIYSANLSFEIVLSYSTHHTVVSSSCFQRIFHRTLSVTPCTVSGSASASSIDRDFARSTLYSLYSFSSRFLGVSLSPRSLLSISGSSHPTRSCIFPQSLAIHPCSSSTHCTPSSFYQPRHEVHLLPLSSSPRALGQFAVSRPQVHRIYTVMPAVLRPSAPSVAAKPDICFASRSKFAQFPEISGGARRT